MIKLINVFILSLLLLISSQAYSADVSTPADVEENASVELIMMNVSNQFVYSFFGRDILLYYLNDDAEIETIKEASETDLVNLSKPFNAVIGQLIMVSLTLVYGVTVGYFIARLVLVGTEIGWMLQKDGVSHFNFKERRGMIIKIVVFGGLAVTPISLKNDLVDESFYTSAATVFLFEFIGKTNYIGDDAISELVDSQRQTLKTLTLPAADAKTQSALSLNSFYTCVRFPSGRDNLNQHSKTIPLYINNNGTLKGNLSVGDCSLDISLGIDNESDKKIKKINSASPQLGFSDNLFRDAQVETYNELLPRVFNRAFTISEELIKPEFSSSWEDGNFTFKNHTTSELSVGELRKWPVRCSELEGWTSPDGAKISRRDRVYYNYLTARCQSRDIADTLVYPDSYDAMSNYLGNNASAQKELALCVDQASMTDALSNSRFVAEYGIGASDGRSNNIEQIAIDSCVANLCAEANLKNGNMYACTNALDLYETRLRDERIKNRGTMMLGFYMFDLFLHHPPSPAAKRIFNNLSFGFSPNSFTAEQEPEGTPFLSFTVSIPAVTGNALDRESVIVDLSKPLGSKELPDIEVPLAATESLATKIFGNNRLETCAKNPLQVQGGYVCGNIPQEFSRFGMTVLKSAVTLKTALMMGQTVGMLKKAKVGEKGGSVQGYLANPTIVSSARKTGVFALNLITGDGDGFGNMFDSVFNLEWNVTDEFGYLNTPRMDSILSTLPAMALSSLAYIGADSSFVSVVDGFLLVLLIIGVLFAFVLPLFPMVMVINALIKFSYLLFSTLIMHGKKLVDVAFDRDSDVLNENLDSVWADYIALILKLPLTIIGVVLAWLMTSVVLSHVLNTMNLMVPTNDGVQGILDLFVSMIVSGVIILVIYNTVLTIIESFYDFTVEWVLSSMHNNPFASETKGVGWQDAKEVLNLMGR